MKTPLLLILLVFLSPGLHETARATETAHTATPDRADAFNTVFLEFFDPSASQLSEPLTYLWSRQLDSSIANLRDAQVTRIFSRDPTSPAAHALMTTPSGSHDLATDAGTSAKAQLVVWGVLADVDIAGVTLAVSLTLPPGSPHWQTLPSTSNTRAAGLTPPLIDLDRINLAPLTAPLNAIYGQYAIARCSPAKPCVKGALKLFSTPRPDAPSTPLAQGEILNLDISPNTRMPSAEYVPVTRVRKATEAGWVLADDLDFLPTEIFLSSRAHVSARHTPNAQSNAEVITGPLYLPVSRITSTKVRSPSRQSLSGASHKSQQWYFVTLPNGHRVWIAATDVRPVWSSRYLNFIAGLYNYALGQFDPAFDEFEAFVRRADENEENVAVSRAYQFMAASLLASTPVTDIRRRDLAIDLLDKAVSLTPFDRQSLALRMYARVGWRPSYLLSAHDAALMAADLNYDKELLGTSRDDLDNEDNVNKITTWLAANNPSPPNPSPSHAPITAPRSTTSPGNRRLLASGALPPHTTSGTPIHTANGAIGHAASGLAAHHSHSVLLVSNANGAPRELRYPERGMKIQYGLGGNRRVVVDNPDQSRTIVEASDRGYVQRPYHYGGQEFSRRTYYDDGNTYTRYYRRYSYHGTQLDLYTSDRRYPASFYGWMSNPWAAPVTYAWDWRDQPWFTRIAHYFSPSSVYTGPSSWLTDYLMASSLRDTQPTESTEALSSQFESAGLTPDVKQLIADEVKHQVQSEALEESHPADATPQLFNDDQSHVFVAGTKLDLIDAKGSECALSEGDVVMVPSASTPGPTAVTAIVIASKGASECKRSTSVSISLNDLQDMQNHMRATIDAGMVEILAKQKMGVLPSALPTTASTPTPAPFVAAGPAPDPEVGHEIAEQWQFAKAFERVTVAAHSVAETPPAISLGQSINDVRALLGDPTRIISMGNKIIYSYKDLRITFKDGKVSDVQ